MNMMRKNKVLNLSILVLTAFSLIFISAVTSFAFQDHGPGSAKTVKPIMIDPGTGGGGSDDDWEGVVLLNCRNLSYFRDCYRSQTRYCPGTLERDGGPDACYSNAWDICHRTYCQDQE